MFDIGWSELALIGVVAIVVIGPKDMPKVMKQVGKFVRTARKIMRDFQNQVEEVVHAEEVKEFREQLEKHGITDFHEQIQRELDNTAAQMQEGLTDNSGETSDTKPKA
ncbi:MAG: twin-arginine translocase subunit TatB [Alphaproteobacteria bacterium]|nr:MAG: twin-arginine translocase subunit TatB [Alphaproteobacteria bacterium]